VLAVKNLKAQARQHFPHSGLAVHVLVIQWILHAVAVRCANWNFLEGVMMPSQLTLTQKTAEMKMVVRQPVH
jgi:hypothetical protein